MDWFKKCFYFSFPNVTNKKGIYIIWNKTKDKYYVGQSKNMSRRLSQHFKNGDVKNVIFAKDWYNGDYFCYKYYFCETKDELDSLEKNILMYIWLLSKVITQLMVMYNRRDSICCLFCSLWVCNNHCFNLGNAFKLLTHVIPPDKIKPL